MSKYKCVIFDCDGVLIDSETIAVGTMIDMANDLGANIEKEGAIARFKGKSFGFCMETISRLIEKPLPETFEDDYRERSFQAFKEHIKPIEGIREVVQNLKVPFCTASSGPENKIRLNLGLTGLLPFLKKIFLAVTPLISGNQIQPFFYGLQKPWGLNQVNVLL